MSRIKRNARTVKAISVRQNCSLRLTAYMDEKDKSEVYGDEKDERLE